MFPNKAPQFSIEKPKQISPTPLIMCCYCDSLLVCTSLSLTVCKPTKKSRKNYISPPKPTNYLLNSSGCCAAVRYAIRFFHDPQARARLQALAAREVEKSAGRPGGKCRRHKVSSFIWILLRLGFYCCSLLRTHGGPGIKVFVKIASAAAQLRGNFLTNPFIAVSLSLVTRPESFFSRRGFLCVLIRSRRRRFRVFTALVIAEGRADRVVIILSEMTLVLRAGVLSCRI